MTPEEIMQQIQFFNKYSRFLYEKGRRETWGQMVSRTVEFLKKQAGESLDDDTMNAIFMSIFNQEISPSMRLMATAGKSADTNQLGVYNCSFLPLSRVGDLYDLTILLGHGVGVGFSVENTYVKQWEEIPALTKTVYNFEVDDSIQGWAFSFLAQISNALDGYRVNFDYSKIRPSGSPLMTRGGTASGPEPLRQAHEAIQKILEARQGLNLRSVDLFDIACHVAGAIVSGGVRRCLPSGSMVHARRGMVPIEKIKVGEEVLTASGYRKVSNIFEQGSQKLVRVVTQDSSFACTPNHRVAVFSDGENYTWKMAGNLELGDKLVAPSLIPVNFVRLEDVEGEEETWDLEVEDVHEFFCEGYLVHNSAMIAIFDKSDTDMMTSKSGEWYLDNLQRQYANISFVIDRRMTLQEWQGYVTMMDLNKSGEPGIWSRYAIKRHLPKRRTYVEEFGPNPCVEQILRPYELCNLSQIIARPEDTFESLTEKIRLATIVGTIQSSMVDFKNVSDKFRENCEDERLLGVSISGIMDCPLLVGGDKKVLEALKQTAIAANKEWAEKLGINASVSVTCVKPDGNTSVLYNSAPGVHGRFAPYYIRRMRVQYGTPVANFAIAQGIPAEPAFGETWEDCKTLVLSFPVKSPEGAIIQRERGAIEQLNSWLAFKKHYTETNPSVTINYRSGELKEIAQWLFDHQDYAIGLSFLPVDDHTYQQAPYEEISAEQYEEMAAAFSGIDTRKFWAFETHTDTTETVANLACTGGACLF